MKGAIAKAVKRPAVCVPSLIDPRETLVTAANPMPRHGVAVKTSRARAVVDDAVADAVAGAADVVKKVVTGRFPRGPARNNQPVAGPLPRGITAGLTSSGMNGWMNGWMNRRTVAACPWRQLATITVAIGRNRPETVTAMRTGLRDVGADVADGAAAAADAVIVTVMPAPGRRQTAKAAKLPVRLPMVRPALPIRITTTSRCPPAMALATARGHPRGLQPTLVGRMHPGMTVASRPARRGPKTASQANQEAVGAAVGDAAKDVVAMPAAPPHRRRAAARAPHHVARVKAVQVKPVRVKRGADAADVAAGARGTNVVLPPRSIAVAAMNLPPLQEGVRKTTRDSSSLESRTPAKTAAAVTTVIRWTTTTASLRAVSTRCSTCRAGWRQLASSSRAISKPAADRPAEETAAVAGSRAATHRHAAALRTGPATHAVAVARAISGNEQPAEEPRGRRCKPVANGGAPWPMVEPRGRRWSRVGTSF